MPKDTFNANHKWEDLKQQVLEKKKGKRQSFFDVLTLTRAKNLPKGGMRKKMYTMDGSDILDVVGRQSKIICTIGPVTQSVEALKKLLKAGMNVARMNFSHGSHEYHAQTIANIRQACTELGVICGIMLDTKGPEIRTGEFLTPNTELKANTELILNLTDPKFMGTSEEIFVDYRNLADVVTVGGVIKVDDGLIVLKVLECKSQTYVKCLVQNTAPLGARKGVNLPGAVVDLPSLTERDIGDITFGVKHNVDYVALSFTRTQQDVINCRDLLQNLGGDSIKIIVKIENREGLHNFSSILKETDAVMVARGDLGVEIPLPQVSIQQKRMIRMCNLAGKPVITATQMLESMVVNPRPTRAEVNDVANAVFDGTDCVMLSGETAKGDYPTEAVQVMVRIAQTAEFALNYKETFQNIKHARRAQGGMKKQEALAASAVQVASDMDTVSAIIVPTCSGETAILVAKYRPAIPVIAVTNSYATARRLMLSRNVVPIVVKDPEGNLTNAELFRKGVNVSMEYGWTTLEDQVVVVAGSRGLTSGIVSTLRVLEVSELMQQ